MADRTYSIRHLTEYRYSAAMTDGYTVACLVPRPTGRQRVLTSDVHVEPAASELDSHLDAFGNLVSYFGWHGPHERVAIVAESVVVIADAVEPIDMTAWEEVAETCRDGLRGEAAVEVGLFTGSSRFVDLAAHGDELREEFSGAFEPGLGIVEVARRVCRSIFETYAFDPHFSEVSTPLGEVLRARRGVCQDFAHLAVGALRSSGLAARYVSGYLETLPPEGQPKLVGADASHAWCSVWTPEAGWVDFDPTNGHLPTDDHLTVAWGRDYGDVTPVRGVMIGPAARQELVVAVDVTRTESTTAS